jgi:cobalamin biosynthesis protein CobT
MAWRGLTDHECAHVEYSDFEVLDRRMIQWEADEGSDGKRRLLTLTNIFEDIWIEREWGALYPGAIDHFRTKNEYVVEKNGGSEVCDPSYVIPQSHEPIGMWGAFVQAVLRVGRKNVKLDEVHEDVKNLMAECKAEILQGWAAGTTIEACDAAERVWAKLKTLGKEPEPEPEPAPGSGKGGPEEGEPGEGEPGEGEGEPGEGESGEGESGDGEGDGAGEGDSGKGETIKRGGDKPNPNGAGATLGEARKLAAEAVGGTWGEVKSDAEVVASKYLGEMPPLYTVHPDALKIDTVITYDESMRAQGRPNLKQLELAAGPATQKLMGMMRGAVAASRMSRVIGGMEEGDGLDENAIPGIAMGFRDPAIFQTVIREIKESTGVVIQVDCSGSMGSSRPKCDDKGGLTMTTKAGYAAVTAMALHKALQGVRVPHCVLGYSTQGYASYSGGNSRQANGYMEWSRCTGGLESHVFVPAPGIYDDGAALPFITGRNSNLDGESIMWAARYGAQHFGHLDRLMLVVIADGLPAGADDCRIEGLYLQQAVEMVAHAGIEVYGVGTCIHDMRTFSSYYPDNKGGGRRAPTGSIEIKSQEGLTDSVLRKMTALMTRGYGMTRRGRG